MTKLSKRMQTIQKELQSHMPKNALEAFDLLKKLSTVKFTESVDVSVCLGIDAKKSDQNVRSATVLPHGTGSTVRVAVMTQEANAAAAKEAGADIVGLDDLADAIKAGNFNFDVLIATPDAMPVVGKLGQILGPKGLMPNPKVGTVTTDVVDAVKKAKAGQVRYRTDKAGVVHCRIGNVKFSSQELLENLEALLADLKKVKPASSKGIYLKKISVSTTMGPGFTLDPSSFI